MLQAERTVERMSHWHCRPVTEEETLARLSATVDRATEEALEWTLWLTEISATLGDAAVMLAVHSQRGDGAGQLIAVGILPDFVRAYEDTYFLQDPWAQRLSARTPWIGFGYELVPRWDLLRSGFYREWMAPQGLLPDLSIAGLILRHCGRPLVTLTAFRRVGGRVFQLEDITLLRRLLPHLQHALRTTGSYRKMTPRAY